MGTSASQSSLEEGLSTGEVEEAEASVEDVWLLPVSILLEFSHFRSYEELTRMNALKRWTPSCTVVMISHQWAGAAHPDPKLRQFQVLQQLFRYLSAGRVTIGQVESMEPVNFHRCMEWYVWYDYCCLPQMSGARPAAKQLRQIFHIVDYFLVLAPMQMHANGSIMNLRSHSTRGWCLLEMMAANLLDKPILAATGPKSIFQSVTKARMHKLPHKGQFSVTSDQEFVKELSSDLLHWKCRELHEKDQEMWRFYNAFAQRLQVHISPSRSLESFWKRYQLGASVTTANLYGLSPLMLACVEGNLSEVQLLLEAKAEVNESRHTVMGSETTALCVATMSSPPVVRSLLDAKADTQVGHPMSWAVQYLNLEILSLLPEELHREKSGSGDSPINLAVQAQCTSTVDVLLQMGADPTALATTSRCSVQFSRPRRKRKSQVSSNVSNAESCQTRRSLNEKRRSMWHDEKIARSLEAASEASNMPQARWWRRANRTSRSTTGSTEEDSTSLRSWADRNGTGGVRFDLNLKKAEEDSIATSPTNSAWSFYSDAKGEFEIIQVTLASPLEIACYAGNLEMVQLLFHAGADPEDGSDGYSAVDVAEACGHHHIMRFLSMAMPLSYVTL
ncbi:unnamed protein product [Durusdinium trenchii]|uniref:Uncharacterized protein n=2 Tax=Durusdinium trenchii TaxID=1381693 RepID=A0ABP0JQY2_9DINO